MFNSLIGRLPQTGPLTTNHTIGRQMATPGKAIGGWPQPWLGRFDGRASNSWAEALADYEANRQLYAGFHALIERPVLDFRLDYSPGANMPFSHLVPLKQTSQALSAASGCELRLANPAAATLHLRAGVSLVKGSGHELLLITRLVRIATAAILSDATWDHLQHPHLADAGLAQLQADWGSQCGGTRSTTPLWGEAEGRVKSAE